MVQYKHKEIAMNNLQDQANDLGVCMWEYSNGEVAAANSTRAQQLSEAGLHVVSTANPREAMTASQIKAAVDSGKKVYWSHKGYEVIKDRIGQYLIVCLQNKHCIGLTWQDGVTLNGNGSQFFIGE